MLSLPEPLATLVVLGLKRIVTTGRTTRHRGLTLIYTPGLGGANGRTYPRKQQGPWSNGTCTDSPSSAGAT